MPGEARIELLLALADDELIMGHRLSEWTGWVPYIEEDLALSSIAQDEIAHARTLYEIVVALDPSRDVDALALGRAPDDYRNAILCERTNRDFAYTIARHWLYDHADDVRLAALESTSFEPLRDAVTLLRMEEQYHLEHANAWFARLANGPVDARHRFAAALTDAYAEALAIFEPVDGEDALIADGTLPAPFADLRAAWVARVEAALAGVGLEHATGAPGADAEPGEMIPTSSGEIEREQQAHASDGTGGRHGKHSDDFAPLWEEMTALYRAHPGAKW
jgi:ring-1,2-phenylacetyl-CoA epoxidase subunit PaaC